MVPHWAFRERKEWHDGMGGLSTKSVIRRVVQFSVSVNSQPGIVIHSGRQRIPKDVPCHVYPDDAVVLCDK